MTLGGRYLCFCLLLAFVLLSNARNTLLTSLFRRPSPSLYAAVWTLILIVTVVVASLAPGIAFTLALSPCGDGGFLRIPLELPREVVCLPEHTVITRSHLDFFLPTLFAAMVVGASACLLRSLALGEGV